MKKILYIIAAVLCLAGCRVTYSFSGTSIDPDVHTISIPTFEKLLVDFLFIIFLIMHSCRIFE